MFKILHAVRIPFIPIGQCRHSFAARDYFLAAPSEHGMFFDFG